MMTPNILKHREKKSPWIILVGLAALLGLGYQLTNGDGKHPVAAPEPFDPASYLNSDEFKAKHPAPPHITRQKIQPSGVPDHMTTSTASENTPWPFKPPELNGNENKVFQIIEALKTVMDIELDINVYDLGLVRKIQVEENGGIELEIIFTTLFCPYSETLKKEMKTSILGLKWCKDLIVNVDVQSTWSRNLLTPEGRNRFKEVFGW